MLLDSLTDAHGAVLRIQAPCVELRLHQISQSGTFVFENSFLFISYRKLKNVSRRVVSNVTFKN